MADDKTTGPRRNRTPIAEAKGPQSGTLRSIWHDHGLSLVLLTLFMMTVGGQTVTGWHVYNQEQKDHGEAQVAMSDYLVTGHFGEALFENWESEFLQMAFYILLTAFLYQRGSSESKRPDVMELVDVDPRTLSNTESSPWPVRRGGFILTLYENSLSLAFVLLFAATFTLHAVTGAKEYSADQMAHAQSAVTVGQYLRTSQFWFESFQNWQSEFLAMLSMVVLSIFLRQRGSPESKPVDAATWDTGG
jgi:hypothetical protein